MQLRQRLLIPAVKAFIREKLRFSFLSALPVIFDMTNGPMELDRSLEDSYGLTMEVLRHIKDHADISQDVKDRINLVDLMAK